MQNLIFFYDTETTGLPDWNQPSNAPQQPHLVQLAACLVVPETRQIIQSMDVIIRPDNWEIPKDVSDVHGITTDYARAVGISEKLAVDMLWEMYSHRLRIAHNESFDARIIRIALKRYFDDVMADNWKSAPGGKECTAKLSTPICALPPTEKMMSAGRLHNKTPNLSEAYQFFTGRELENAHTAMADVLACMEVYWAVKGVMN